MRSAPPTVTKGQRRTPKSGARQAAAIKKRRGGPWQLAPDLELSDTEVPHTEQTHMASVDRAPTQVKKKMRKPSMCHGLLDQVPPSLPDSLA